MPRGNPTRATRPWLQQRLLPLFRNPQSAFRIPHSLIPFKFREVQLELQSLHHVAESNIVLDRSHTGSSCKMAGLSKLTLLCNRCSISGSACSASPFIA